ncbi:FUSC family protein [Neisseriaceae bacterium TC5R-5]|nr:FUSC family protein [Neisseriaceae bacterium TC5R-5]
MLSYQKTALRSLAVLHRQQPRLLRAMLISLLLFTPATLFSLSGLNDLIYPFTLAATYGVIIYIQAKPLSWPSILLLPTLCLAGRLSIPFPPAMFGLLFTCLVLMASSARRGWHKGIQFWVFGLLLGNMTQSSSLLPWQEALLMVMGCTYGVALARLGLYNWGRILPGASVDDSYRYMLHLVPAGLLAWLLAYWMHWPHGWWLVLLAVGIPDPSPERLLQLAKERIIGTLQGALFAAALFYLSLSIVLHSLGLCLMLTVALVSLQRNFRLFVSMLTALVLSLLPASQFGHGVLERVIDTLAAALFFSLLLWLLALRARLRKEQAATAGD